MGCRGPCSRHKYDAATDTMSGCMEMSGHDGPCTDGVDYERYRRNLEREQIIRMQEIAEAKDVKVTMRQLLCSACRVLARMNFDFDENPALSQWWEKHKEEDKEAL